MTASAVEGVAVIADEPTASPLTDRAGKRVFWQQTRTLLLADGSTVFGCAHCEYVADSAAKIRPHLRAHTPPRPDSRGGGRAGKDAIVVLAREVDAVTADRDRWKARAQKAERSLAQLRRALAVD